MVVITTVSSPTLISSTVATLIANASANRYSIRFQNVGTSDIYIKRDEGGSPVSSTSYEILLPSASTCISCPDETGNGNSGGKVNSCCCPVTQDSFIVVKATDSFHAISASSGGKIAIYEEFVCC